MTRTPAIVRTVPATVLHVIDADTVKVDLDLGWRIRYLASVRIDAVNAPELATDDGRAARVWAANLLPSGLSVTVVSRRLDKYGRVLGAVLMPDGRDYAALLVAAGHAHPL